MDAAPLRGGQEPTGAASLYYDFKHASGPRNRMCPLDRGRPTARRETPRVVGIISDMAHLAATTATATATYTATYNTTLAPLAAEGPIADLPRARAPRPRRGASRRVDAPRQPGFRHRPRRYLVVLFC